MNKSRVSKRFSKCNLKQTDIFTCFRNWQSFERDKKKRKMALSSEVIVVGDSDSESTTINPDNNWPKKKRPLAEPFSEEDDNNEDITTTLPLKPIQTNILPKIKRPLSHGFSDEQNVEYKKSDAGSGDAATPSKIKETVMNNKNNSLNHPLACSTPLPASNHDTANTLGNHIGYTEALQISQIDNNNISDSCSVSSIDSEQTIILDQSSLIKNNITVQENLIIATSYTNNVTKAVSPHSSNSKNPVGPSKRGCVEQEKDRKKLKIVHENSSCGSNVPSVSKENESSLEMSRGNNTCGRSFGIEATRTSIADDKMDASREVGKKVSKSTGKWLSKKNKFDCDSNQRKILNSGEEARKNVKTSDRNTCDIREKSGSSKKSPQTHKNSIKVPSKENMPNHSKNLENNSNDGSSKTSSGQSHVERDKNSTSVKVAKSGSSPKKGGNVTGLSSDKSFKAKKEEKKMNKEPLLLITELFKTVFSSRHVNNLCETEREAITTFFDMDFRYQYACLKLITRQTKWYNVYKFCSLIYLEMEDIDISDMVKFFERKGIVDTVYTEESAEHLLSRLNNTEIRGICDKFRLKKTLKTKDEMIKHLLKYSNNQCTLTVHKTTKDLLMDEIQRRLGRCMRVSKDFQDAFYSIYTLSTYTNPRFSSMKDYFKSMLDLKVQVPDFNINDYIIFNSRNDFIRYLEAKKYRDELENCKNHLEGLQICETVFVKLKALENHNDDETFQNAPHLVRFTARAVYVSSLSSMANTLFAKFPYQVKTWLEYMIKKVNFPHKIGNWYYHLIWLYMKYLKPFNYDRAAELLVEVLHRKGEHLSEVQLYRLRERGKQLLSTRKYKILQMNHDLIVHLLPKRLKVEEFPKETIDAKAIRSNLPQKRNYEVRDGEGNKIIYKVEGIALEHYLDHGYTGGEHCEGAFVLATFTLFFFDIIYKPRDVIPGTFVSKIQSEPLDMNSRYFYSNRREQIDRRLREIESEWSDAQVLKFLRDNYEKHSHEFAVCEVGMIIKDESLLKVLVECVGRKIWAKIYERLVKNFREYRSGLPDLLVWNEHKKYCKFVEVKGENDKLSVGQKLWLDYLRKIGAQIEVCHVHSIGSKGKMKKVGDKDLQEASTSSSSSSEKVP